MSDEFFVGQRVVCVDAKNTAFFPWLGDIPVEGDCYTVTGFGPSSHIDGSPTVFLREIKSNCGVGDQYRASRFRPLPFKSESIFRKIARDIIEGKRVEVDA